MIGIYGDTKLLRPSTANPNIADTTNFNAGDSVKIAFKFRCIDPSVVYNKVYVKII